MNQLILTIAPMGRFLFQCVQFLAELFAWASGHTARKERRAAEQENKLVLRKAAPVPAGHDFSAYRPAAIFTYRVTDRDGVLMGTLKFWFTQETRRFARDFSFVHQGMMEAFGTRNIPLPPLVLARGDTLPALREASLREIEAILKRKLNGERMPKAAVAAPLSALPRPVASVAAQPAVAAPVAAPAAKIESPAAARAPTAKIRSQDEGVLLGYGIAPREIVDNAAPGGSKMIQQFYVDLRLTTGETPGVVKRIWGADLQRALNDGKAQTNMLVRVSFFGRTKVSGDEGGAASYKNLYEIVQIGANK